MLFNCQKLNDFKQTYVSDKVSQHIGGIRTSFLWILLYTPNYSVNCSFHLITWNTQENSVSYCVSYGFPLLCSIAAISVDPSLLPGTLQLHRCWVTHLYFLFYQPYWLDIAAVRLLVTYSFLFSFLTCMLDVHACVNIETIKEEMLHLNFPCAVFTQRESRCAGKCIEPCLSSRLPQRRRFFSDPCQQSQFIQ